MSEEELTIPAEDLLGTWQISNRVVLYVLTQITPEQLGARPQNKGRTVGEMLAHLHNTRLLWLEVADKSLHASQTKLSKEEALDKDKLTQALQASAEAMTTLVQRAVASRGRVKGFKPHPTAFVGYLIAHDFYHLGEVGIYLAQSGFPLDQKTAFGMWEWGVR